MAEHQAGCPHRVPCTANDDAAPQRHWVTSDSGRCNNCGQSCICPGMHDAWRRPARLADDEDGQGFAELCALLGVDPGSVAAQTGHIRALNSKDPGDA